MKKKIRARNRGVTFEVIEESGAEIFCNRSETTDRNIDPCGTEKGIPKRRGKVEFFDPSISDRWSRALKLIWNRFRSDFNGSYGTDRTTGT